MKFAELLQALISTNSISSVNPSVDQGNRAAIELLGNQLRELGFEVEIMSLEDPRKANLIATLGSGPGGLVLSGHMDTVPCDEQLWQHNPFSVTEEDGRLYGLGTCDMKGFFPLAVEAARPFLDQPLKHPLIILATADEESSMCGALELVAAGRPQARYAVIGEPTGMKPITMHKGILVEKLVIEGASGHSSDPELGANAMHSMHRVLSELLSLQEELKARDRNPKFKVDYSTLNLGCIFGGDNPNRICGHCELGFEVRPLPGVDLGELQQEIEARLLPLGHKEDTRISISHHGVPAFSAAADSDLAKLCEQLTGHSSEAVAFATEAPFLQQLGMDVLVLGPGDISRAHQPDEFLPMERIDPMVDLLQKLIAKYCLDPNGG